MKARELLLLLTTLSIACGDSTAPGDPVDQVGTVAIGPGIRELAVGQALTLVATVTSTTGKPLSRTVTWSSDDLEVAVVSPTGEVVAVGAGTADITASVDGKHDVASVVVAGGGSGPVATVTLNDDAVDLEEGHPFSFLATPKDHLGRVVEGRVAQWSSSNPAVAVVNPIGIGRVLPIKPGVTTITARIDGKTAEAIVEVYAAYPFELVYEASGPTGPSLFRLDINDPEAEPTLVIPGPVTDAEVSPDGSRISYVVLGANGHSTIWVADRNGGNARPVTIGPGQHDQPSWSPDGTRIAYRRWHWQGGEGSDIWSVDVTGPLAPVNLTADTPTSEGEPAWSRHIGGESRIAYVRTVQAQGTIWVMASDGTAKSQLTAGFFDAQPAWSPDGDLIVFQRSGPALFGDLYLVVSDGSTEPWRLTLLPQIQRTPAWSPDGKLIAFVSSHEDGIERIFTIAPGGNRIALRTGGAVTHANPSWAMK